MTPQQINQMTAIVALVLMAILFLLVSSGTIPALAAIVLTIGIGLGARFVRSRSGKP